MGTLQGGGPYPCPAPATAGLSPRGVSKASAPRERTRPECAMPSGCLTSPSRMSPRALLSMLGLPLSPLTRDEPQSPSSMSPRALLVMLGVEPPCDSPCPQTAEPVPSSPEPSAVGGEMDILPAVPEEEMVPDERQCSARRATANAARRKVIGMAILFSLMIVTALSAALLAAALAHGSRGASLNFEPPVVPHHGGPERPLLLAAPRPPPPPVRCRWSWRGMRCSPKEVCRLRWGVSWLKPLSCQLAPRDPVHGSC